MLLLVKKRLDEMVADNDIKTQMQGKRLQVERVEVLKVFEQSNPDKWSCYDGMKSDDEADVDCGGGCTSGCTMNSQCQSRSDCVEGLYCTRGKCIDRSGSEMRR